LDATFSGILIPAGAGCHETKRYSDEQIAFALRQAENGTLVEEICSNMDVSEATFYLKKKAVGRDGRR